VSRRLLLLAGTPNFFWLIATAYADLCGAPLPTQAGVRFSGMSGTLATQIAFASAIGQATRTRS
jgi:hypothetical protein